MDPAELQAFRNVAANIPVLVTELSRQQGISGENTQGLQVLGRAVNTVQEELKDLTVLLRQGLGSQPAPGSDTRHTGSGSASSSSPPPGSGSGHDGIRLPHPERYDGDMGNCKYFLTQCSIAFQLQPRFYPNDRAKIAYIISLLTGKALAWATPAWNQDVNFCFVLDEFVEEMKKVFDHPVSGREAGKRLVTIRQGRRSVAEFAVDFRTLAGEVAWADAPLITLFEEGLNADVRDDLATREIPERLDTYIDLAIRVDNRIRERLREKGRAGASGASSTRTSTGEARADPRYVTPPGQGATPPSSTTRAEPMQLGRAKLTKEEREHRMRMGLCLYCAGNHVLANCPTCPPKDQAQ